MIPGAAATTAGWLRELGRTVAWHRRLVSAALLAGAVALGLSALSPPDAPTVKVLISAHDLDGGSPLRASDLVVADLARAAVPDGALRRPGDVDDRTLVGPVRAGEVITDVRLVGRSFLEAYGEQLVASPVRIADAAAVSLLRPGDVIDVLAASAGSGTDGSSAAEARLVAAAVRVVTIPESPDSGFSAGTLGEGALVVLATTSETATRLAAASVTARLSVTIRAR